jgi:hypothetical protein
MLRFRLALTFALVLFLGACSDKPSSQTASDKTRAKPTNTDVSVKEESEPIDPGVAVSLREEIKNVRAQIVEAESESARYTGGLVKALIESRLQTLKQTLAMLEQRDKAWTFGLRLRYTVDGKPFSLPPGIQGQLPEVEHELRDVASQIESQQQEVARYSGGLVHAMGLSTLATMKQTEAMLNQRRLAIRFELPQYLAFNRQESPTTQPTVPSPSAPAAPQPATTRDDDWEIVSVASRPGESNSSWTRFAWKLTIRNKSAYPQKFDATIEFRDGDGFPVDSDNEYNLVVPAGGQETFTGEKLINANQVGRIATTAAKVKKDT